MILKKLTFIFILFIAGFSACKKSTINQENLFIKIYDDPNADLTYYSIDIAQTESGNFFILGANALDTTRTWTNPVIIYTDEFGDVLWQSDIGLPFVNPVSELMKIGSDYYFFCMDELTLVPYLLRINQENQSAELVNSYDGLTYPLSVSKTPDNGFILLTYNSVLRQSVLSKINSQFEISWETTFNVMEDVEPFIIDHLIKTGKEIPFFTGTIGEGSATYYFANGMNNYTLSMLFVNSSNGDKAGIAQGFRYDAGAVSAVSLQGNRFAISRSSFGDHYISPSVEIDINAITSLSDIGGLRMEEIEADSRTCTEKINSNSKIEIVIGASTNNNQIVLYFLDPESLEIKGKRHLGFSNQVRIASIIQTADLGLAVLAQTKVAGRFSRICIYKLPKEYLF